MAGADNSRTTPDGRRRNRRVAVACLVFVTGMVGAAFAAVPLYDLFCQVTGFGGTTQRAQAAPLEISDRTVTVRFDANVAAGLPWRVTPVERTLEVRLGEVVTAFYEITNESATAAVGRAAFNVAPVQTGSYFSKIDCFCFTEQLLGAGETQRLGVTFYVDPALADGRDTEAVQAITLSYTFYPLG